MGRDIELFEDMTITAVSVINADDCVEITIRDKLGQRGEYEWNTHFHSTRQLFEILHSKQSVLDVLFGKTDEITLHVDYWTLYECRDRTLDDTRARPDPFYTVGKTDHMRAHYHERMYPTASPESPLTDSELCELRSLLQRFPYLHVEFSCTAVFKWDSDLIGAWIGVIRTFPTISDIDTSWSDKYGFSVTEFLDNAAKYWKPARILRLRGSDNHFYAGQYHSYGRYITVADCGLDEGGWRELVDHFDDVHTCGPLIRFMSFSSYRVHDSAACAKDFAYGARYFPNVRKLYLDMSIGRCEPATDGVKVFEMPGMLQLRKLVICVNKATGLNRGDTLEIRIGPCPRLVSADCETYIKDVTVRIVCAKSEPITSPQRV